MITKFAIVVFIYMIFLIIILCQMIKMDKELELEKKRCNRLHRKMDYIENQIEELKRVK